MLVNLVEWDGEMGYPHLFDTPLTSAQETWDVIRNTFEMYCQEKCSEENWRDILGFTPYEHDVSYVDVSRLFMSTFPDTSFPAYLEEKTGIKYVVPDDGMEIQSWRGVIGYNDD